MRISQSGRGLQKVIFLTLFVLMMGVSAVHLVMPILVYDTNHDEPVETAPFPVGIDPAHKRIVENPDVESYLKERVPADSSADDTSYISWVRHVLSKLVLREWYQNLASLSSRILVILSGERKEEVAEHFGNILGWDKAGRREFIERVVSASPQLAEGKFTPYTYVIGRGARPAEMAALVVDQFQKDTLSRYGSSTASIVPLADALTIASLLEREGKDFDDMRQISGIIWNRLFRGMNLQIDATLQYAKGSKMNQRWWSPVIPADKQIASAFNTYTHVGLPPAPIANPSLDAILAALNPKNTKCRFYFHDADGGFHCSVTYAEHVALLKHYYGRGK